jgi:hypothetical protein
MIGCAVSAVVKATILLMGYNISLVAALKLTLKCVLHAPAKSFYINSCDNCNKTWGSIKCWNF